MKPAVVHLPRQCNGPDAGKPSGTVAGHRPPAIFGAVGSGKSGCRALHAGKSLCQHATPRCLQHRRHSTVKPASSGPAATKMVPVPTRDFWVGATRWWIPVVENRGTVRHTPENRYPSTGMAVVFLYTCEVVRAVWLCIKIASVPVYLPAAVAWS